MDSEITSFDVVEEAGRITISNFRHPPISSGVVVETPEGWVVATGDESEADTLAVARQHSFDMEACDAR
ncbi:MAG: hypothetical protein FJ125_13955 [Deltaproteobacteria bacterium]|nr:hypothetical protein [Deltaproteobacteria bacterium]